MECGEKHQRKVNWPPKSKHCPTCSNNEKEKEMLSELTAFIDAHSGKLISHKCKRAIIQCKEGHTWSANFTNLIHQQTWCKKCHLKNIYENRLAKIRYLITENKGTLISVNDEELNIRCEFNHEWKTTKQIIVAKSWCPTCSSGKSERICRAIFEKIFNDTFEKIRLNILRSKITNKKLELDGYCKTLGIAFEYNGPHHYAPIYGEDVFIKTRYNDLQKRKMCKNNGISLITIRHKEFTVKTMTSEILKLCKGLQIINKSPNICRDDILYDAPIRKVKDILINNNLECLTGSIYNVHEKILIKCKRGHVFKRNASYIIYSKKSVCLECKRLNA